MMITLTSLIVDPEGHRSRCSHILLIRSHWKVDAALRGGLAACPAPNCRSNADCVLQFAVSFRGQPAGNLLVTLARHMSTRRNDDGAGPSSAAPPAAEPSAAAMSEDEAEEPEASSGGDEEDDAEAGSGEEGVRKRVSSVPFGYCGKHFQPVRRMSSLVARGHYSAAHDAPSHAEQSTAAGRIFGDPQLSRTIQHMDVLRGRPFSRASGTLFTLSCCPSAG